MNRGTMRTETARMCGDKNQTRYTPAEYNTALDRAQEQFALDSRVLWRDQSWTTEDGLATYDLPSDFMYEDWVQYDGAELKPISRHEIARLKGQDWASETGTPEYYIVDPEEARKQVRVCPIPVEAKPLVMRHYPLPASMSGDTSVPLNSSSLMAQFHLSLCAFAAWLLLTAEIQTPEIVTKRNELMAIYLDGKNRAIDTFKNTASAGFTIRGTRLWS